ncbi:MAG: FKBP-type peptidyl-prolyl cis-trans isomerase [Hyphomicrobiaceae bacterium]
MRPLRPAQALLLAALLGGCAGAPAPLPVDAKDEAVDPKATVLTYASGLKVADLKVGTGAFPRKGQTCVMHYTGWLYQGGKKGAKFDSSVDRGKPFEFPLGQGKVIGGWDQGVSTMRVGGRRTLIIPPDLGYGSTGSGTIPPYATLVFEVELLAVKG